jgi:hypothetical protein
MDRGHHGTNSLGDQAVFYPIWGSVGIGALMLLFMMVFIHQVTSDD